MVVAPAATELAPPGARPHLSNAGTRVPDLRPGVVFFSHDNLGRDAPRWNWERGQLSDQYRSRLGDGRYGGEPASTRNTGSTGRQAFYRRPEGQKQVGTDGAMSIHRVAIEEQATGNLMHAELDDALPVDALFDVEKHPSLKFSHHPCNLVGISIKPSLPDRHDERVVVPAALGKASIHRRAFTSRTKSNVSHGDVLRSEESRCRR
jgi:hypothetical protein